MAKYTRGNTEKSGGHEVLGIALVIVSAFLLVCIVIPPVLGEISKAIRNVSLGLLGLFSYPLFLSTLLLGVALVQNRSVSLSTKYIVSIAVIVICAILILQLATSFKFLKDGFSSYISNVYAYKTTGGGILFGVIAFGLQAAITQVATYIVLSLIIVAMVLVMTDVFRYVRKDNVTKSNKSQLPQTARQEKKPIFVKGNASAHPVIPVSDNSLFVGTIQKNPRAISSDSGTFDQLEQRHSYTLSAFNEKPSASNEAYKSEAHKILFDQSFDQYRNSIDAALNVDKPSVPKTAAAEPIVKDNTVKEIPLKKPPKIVHGDYPQLQEVVIPEPKDVTDQYVSGTIINGDDRSKQLEEETAKSSSSMYKKPDLDLPKNNFDYRKITPVALKPIEENIPLLDVEEDSLPPITNGDYFDANKFTSYDKQFPSHSNAVLESSQSKTEESGFEKLLREERERKQNILDNQTKFNVNISDTIDEDTEQFDIINADKLEEQISSFKFVDEVEDLSETSPTINDDHTGYYDNSDTSEMTFGQSVKNIDAVMKESPTQNTKILSRDQIKIDDYMVSQPTEPIKPKKKRTSRYNAPPLDLLMSNSTNPDDDTTDYQAKAKILEETLESLKLPAKVVAITRGPAVTRFELEMPAGIPVKRIETCAQDIEYNLASHGKIRIEAPIPGKRAIGIEVPNASIDIVALRDIIGSKEFVNASSNLSLALGKDISGNSIVCNLESMPHLLIAGSTGSGKSACLNSILMSILYKASPDDVRIILIDPKQVEFVMYRDLPHLLIKNIINDSAQAINAFKWAKIEMDRRYKLFSQYRVRNLKEFNNSPVVKEGVETKLPNIVIVVDELCELMMTNKKDLEEKIGSLAQKARAAGLHLILATQRPSVDVITGTIKANLPSRIAFAVTSYQDSRTILDQGGAESLLGRGDMLYSPLDANEPKRVQGAWVTSEEVASIIDYVKENNDLDFDEAIESAIAVKEEEITESVDEPDDIFDPLMPDVVRRVIESRQASTSMIQRRFSVGYARASRIIDQMEIHGFIGPLEGSKPREVFITPEKFREVFGEDFRKEV